ncbi:MAG: hypothetical protein RR293_06765 [Bacteroidales bacterium]
MKKISVYLSVNKGEILKELTKRSSYTALSLCPDGNIQQGWSDKIILSEDEYFWCEDKMKMVYYKIYDILFAYAAVKDQALADDGGNFIFRLLLDTDSDADIANVITNYIREAFIDYLLAEWFFERLPEKGAYLMSQYETVLGLLRVSLTRRRGKIRRPVSYL